MLGCFDQHHQATGAGLNCLRQRYERHSRRVNVSDHTRLDHRRREFRRLSLYCDNSSERHAELLTRRNSNREATLLGGFSLSTPSGVSNALVDNRPRRIPRIMSRPEVRMPIQPELERPAYPAEYNASCAGDDVMAEQQFKLEVPEQIREFAEKPIDQAERGFSAFKLQTSQSR
jgi:hypothetical protein